MQWTRVLTIQSWSLLGGANMTLSELVRYANKLDTMILEINYITRTAQLANGEVVRIAYPSEMQW